MSVLAGLVGFAAGVVALVLVRLAHRRSVADRPAPATRWHGLQGRMAAWCAERADAAMRGAPDRYHGPIDWAARSLIDAGRMPPIEPPVKKRRRGGARPIRAKDGAEEPGGGNGDLGDDGAPEHDHARGSGPVPTDALPPLLVALRDGRPGPLRRVHARQAYTGPPRLFAAWYAFVHVPRHGRQALTLQAIADAVRTEEPP